MMLIWLWSSPSVRWTPKYASILLAAEILTQRPVGVLAAGMVPAAYSPPIWGTPAFPALPQPALGTATIPLPHGGAAAAATQTAQPGAPAGSAGAHPEKLAGPKGAT